MFHNVKLNKLWNNIDWPRKLIEFSASKPSPDGTGSTSAPPSLERCCTWWYWLNWKKNYLYLKKRYPENMPSLFFHMYACCRRRLPRPNNISIHVYMWISLRENRREKSHMDNLEASAILDTWHSLKTNITTTKKHNTGN
jgi:hypothetical protein